MIILSLYAMGTKPMTPMTSNPLPQRVLANTKNQLLSILNISLTFFNNKLIKFHLSLNPRSPVSLGTGTVLWQQRVGLYVFQHMKVAPQIPHDAGLAPAP